MKSVQRQRFEQRQAQKRSERDLKAVKMYAPHQWRGPLADWHKDGLMSIEEAEACLAELEPMADEYRDAIAEQKRRYGSSGLALDDAYFWARNEIARIRAALIGRTLRPQAMIDRLRQMRDAGPEYDANGNMITDGQRVADRKLEIARQIQEAGI